jgi:hypothetical protein
VLLFMLTRGQVVNRVFLIFKRVLITPERQETLLLFYIAIKYIGRLLGSKSLKLLDVLGLTLLLLLSVHLLMFNLNMD